LFAFIGGAAFAQSASVDWKMYGAVSFGESGVCFYDAKGMRGGPDGTIRVWTKCLRQKDLDGIDFKKPANNTILNEAAKKMLTGYMPPIASVETIDDDQKTAFISYEVTADLSNLKPQSRIYYELNCPERMIRELSMSFEVKGKSTFQDKPREWQYVPPEGNGDRLLRLLCPVK